MLRQGPQHLPASPALLAVALVAYSLSSLATGLSQLPAHKALLAALLDTGLLLSLSYLVLWIRLLGKRWLQTATAMAGSGTIVGALMMPLSYWQTVLSGTPLEAIPYLLLVALLVWDLFIVGNILRHALEVPLLLGSALAGVYLYISLRIFYILFVVTPR